jgi:chaperonin cofactor prefoldin
MDAQTKLKMMIGDLMLQVITLSSQIETLQEQNKSMAEKLAELQKNGTDTTN